MSYKDIDVELLRAVVRGQRRSFATRDVSEDHRTQTALPTLAGHPNYHAFVGRALSVHRETLGLDELRKGTSRGSIWEKCAGGTASGPTASGPTASGPTASEPTATGVALPSGSAVGAAVAGAAVAGAAADLGPQYSGDSPFTARMRRHQSWYRAAVLGLPYGNGPTAAEARKLGNMLTALDGARGANFVTPAIAQVALDRVRRGGGAVEPYRLLHNMLSSQPMCFNLFAPLALDLVAARPFVASLVPDEVAEVTRVDVEWAPVPADEYLGDRTAFDAAIEYVTTTGARCLLGIETKLTEPFSPGEYDRPSYRRWTDGPRSPWHPEHRATLHRSETNQLWRDHLLAIALRDHPRSDLAAARLMVVHHPLDRDCTNVVARYRERLLPGDDSFHVRSLDQVIAGWRVVSTTDAQRAWLDALALRYLDLDAST